VNAALIAASVSFGPTSANAKPPKVVRQVPVDKRFVESELTWAAGIGGYKFMWDVRAVKGIIGICGVGHYEDAYSVTQNNDVMRKTELMLNGKTSLKDMWFFSRAKSDKLLKTTPADCASTGVKVPRKKPRSC